jgi:periplasmic protein CpxP/Spy
MYKKIIWMVTLVLSLALSQTVFANWECGGLKRMVGSLNLSDEQKTKIKPILEQLQTSGKTAGSQMRDLDKQIKQQVISADMDQSTVNGLVDQKTKLIGDMMKAKVTAKNQIFGILTAEQKTKLQNKMKEFEQKMTDKYKKCHGDD